MLPIGMGAQLSIVCSKFRKKYIVICSGKLRNPIKKIVKIASGKDFKEETSKEKKRGI